MVKFIKVLHISFIFLCFFSSHMLFAVGIDGIIVPLKLIYFARDYYYGGPLADAWDEYKMLYVGEVISKLYDSCEHKLYVLPLKTYNIFFSHISRDIRSNNIYRGEELLEIAAEFSYVDLFKELLPVVPLNNKLEESILLLVSRSCELINIFLDPEASYRLDVSRIVNESDFFVNAVPFPNNIRYILESRLLTDDYLNSYFFRDERRIYFTIVHALVHARSQFCYIYLKVIDRHHPQRKPLEKVAREMQAKSLALVLASDRIALETLRSLDYLENNVFHLVDHPKIMKMLLDSRVCTKEMFAMKNKNSLTPFDALLCRYMLADQNNDTLSREELRKVLLLMLNDFRFDRQLVEASYYASNELKTFVKDLGRAYIYELPQSNLYEDSDDGDVWFSEDEMNCDQYIANDHGSVRIN